jgi:signal transduction histidine kinase
LLIVDDEPKNLRLLANIYADDYRLSLATSGAKALELLEITPDIELVLLDVMMPDMDGLAVYERIRAQPAHQDLPVIFVTARNDAALEMRALGSGAADYLLKPVHVGLARVRVQQQITLARQRLELQRARQAAEAGNRAKSQFLTAVSHELRTPLNAILGFGQVLESDGTLADEQRDNVREILDAGTHLLALINDVLDLGKIEAARVDLTLEDIDLPELGQACLRLCEPVSKRRGVSLRNRFDSDLPLVHADRIRVRQVIVNLMSNAIKFNHEGGEVVLSMRPTPEGGIRVEVMDNGPGISADLHPRLFEPFVRGAESERRQIEGTGIGLTICKRLVNMMRGEIGCISEPGLGSRFWFTLPGASRGAVAERLSSLPVSVSPAPLSAPSRAPEIAMPVAAAAPSQITSEQPEPEGETPRTILCIDDNPANLKLLQLVLKRLPRVVVVASQNPAQAVSLAAQHRPLLALVDIQMPDVDGFEVLRRLRTLAPLAQMPVAALSANAMAEDIRAGLAAGFESYFTKPFDVDELLAWVDEALRRAETQRRGRPPLVAATATP